MDFDFRAAALDEIANSAAVKALVGKAAVGIRNDARDRVRGYYGETARANALEVEAGIDAEGIYADVGYLKRHPGFVLFFSEVGTVKMSPRPHLVPAMSAYSI